MKKIKWLIVLVIAIGVAVCANAIFMCKSVNAAPGVKQRTYHHKSDKAHAAAHKATSVPTFSVAAFVSRDLEDGPTLLGGEVLGRPNRRLGLRMTLSGDGQGISRTTVDGLYFFCPKPVQAYVGIGEVIDCEDEEPIVIIVRTPPTTPPSRPRHNPKDPASLIAGIQGRNKSALFAEGRYLFGPDAHAIIAGGMRYRF